jgi:hypothetical protein
MLSIVLLPMKLPPFVCTHYLRGDLLQVSRDDQWFRIGQARNVHVAETESGERCRETRSTEVTGRARTSPTKTVILLNCQFIHIKFDKSKPVSREREKARAELVGQPLFAPFSFPVLSLSRCALCSIPKACRSIHCTHT